MRTEPLYTLNGARNLPELRRNGGKPLSPSTLWRWATSGHKRGGHVVKLETIMQGGARCTSREAIARFFAALSGGHVLEVDHQKEHERSERELEAAGI